MERGELKLVTDFSEVQVGRIFHVDCLACRCRHRGIVTEMVTGLSGEPDGLHGINLFETRGGRLSPTPPCVTGFLWLGFIVSEIGIAQRRVWREEDGLDQSTYDRELAVLEAKAAMRKARESIRQRLETPYADLVRENHDQLFDRMFPR